MGAVVAIVGLMVLATRRPREAILLLVAAAGVFVLTMNVDADVDGFLLPVFVAAAPFVAAGLDTLGGVLGPRVNRRTVVAAGAVLLASWNLAANYRVNDHHTRTFEARYLDALFERLPPKAAIVSEGYASDQLVYYKLVAEHGAAGRDIRIVPRDPATLQDLRADGFDIFALPEARAELAPHGFEFASAPLVGVPLWQHLREVRSGWIAIVAAPPGALREWPADAVDALAASADPRGQAWRSAASIFVVVSGSRPGLEKIGDSRVVLDLDEGGSIGGRLSPAALHAEAGPDGARIVVSGKEAVTTTGEVALVLLTADGRVAQASRIDPSVHLRVPFDDPAFAVSRVTAAAACAELGNRGWQDITRPFSEGRVRLRVDNYRPFDTTVEAYLVANEPLHVAVQHAEGPSPPTMSVTPIAPAALQDALQRDGATLAPPAGALVYRVNGAVNDGGQDTSFILDAHGRVVQAIARVSVDRDNPKRAIACGVPSGDPLGVPAVVAADATRFFGSGWHGVEGEDADAFRWSAALDGELLIPLADARPSRLVVSAMPLPGDRAASIALVLNGEALAPQPLREGWSDTSSPHLRRGGCVA